MQLKKKVVGDAVVGQSATLQLLASEKQPLLVAWDAFGFFKLGFDEVDRVRLLNEECDDRAAQCLHEDLHERCVDGNDARETANSARRLGLGQGKD